MTKERQLFILRGKVQRQKLEEDVDRIVALYKTTATSRRGSSDTTSRWTGRRPGSRSPSTIVEGPQFRVGDDQVHRLTLFPEAEVAASSASRPATSSRGPSCATRVRGITDLYSTIGRASAEVVPRTEQQPATRP